MLLKSAFYYFFKMHISIEYVNSWATTHSMLDSAHLTLKWEHFVNCSSTICVLNILSIALRHHKMFSLPIIPYHNFQLFFSRFFWVHGMFQLPISIPLVNHLWPHLAFASIDSMWEFLFVSLLKCWHKQNYKCSGMFSNRKLYSVGHIMYIGHTPKTV